MAEYKSNGVDGEYIIYKDKPLVRKDNLYCYGNMSDKYVLFLMVISTKKTSSGAEIPDYILAQILSTDLSKSPAERLEKQFEKNGLYEAIDIGTVWLDKLNGK